MNKANSFADMLLRDNSSAESTTVLVRCPKIERLRCAFEVYGPSKDIDYQDDLGKTMAPIQTSLWPQGAHPDETSHKITLA